jgi:hypothetical protein
MSLLPETKLIQSNIALFCRTGNEIELPGVTPYRMHHYRRLVFNIIQDNLESSFPIAYKYIDSEKWMMMVNDFFSDHACQSYQVWQIAGEFFDYAVKENFAEKFKLDFLNDLLKFEWEEMLIYNMEDVLPKAFKANGDIVNDVLVINPEHSLLQLKYPIHIYNPIEAMEHIGNYFVLLFREQHTGKVQFMDISVWFALLIEQISKNGFSLKSLLSEAPEIFGNIDLTMLTKTTIEFINDLKSRNFVLGYTL